MNLASQEQKTEARKNIERVVKREKQKRTESLVLKTDRAAFPTKPAASVLGFNRPPRPKPRRCDHTKKFLHTWTSPENKSTVGYLTDSRGRPPRRLAQEPSPFTSEWSKLRNSFENRPGYAKATQRWTSNDTLRNRIQVQFTEQPASKHRPPTDYLRPFKFSKIEFSRQMRQRFFNVLDMGIMQDLIRQVEERERIARYAVEKSLKDTDEGMKLLDLFLADQLKDNESIENELKTVERFKKDRQEELTRARKKMGDLKVDLFKKMEGIRETVKCRNFLHQVSPKEWLLNYDQLTKQHRKKNASNLAEVKKELSNYREHLAGEDEEIENIVVEFIEILENSGPPLLPFTKGEAIAQVLKQIESRNRELLEHIRGLDEPSRKAAAKVKEIEEYFKQELSEVERTLHNMENDLSELKETRSMKENMLKDAIKCYKRAVSSEDVLKNRALLEGLFEEITGRPGKDRSDLDMWKEIDETFVQLKSKLSQLPRKEVERRRRAFTSQRASTTKKAREARDRHRQIEQMILSATLARLPPLAPRRGKQLRPRSEPPPAPPRSPRPESPLDLSYERQLKLEKSLFAPLSIDLTFKPPPALVVDAAHAVEEIPQQVPLGLDAASGPPPFAEYADLLGDTSVLDDQTQAVLEGGLPPVPDFVEPPLEAPPQVDETEAA